MQSFMDILRKALPDMVVCESEPMTRHTTFRIGGMADMLALPASEQELTQCIALAEKHAIPVTLLGNGSNVLVRDGGIRGLTVILGERFSAIELRGTHIIAQAGASLAKLAAAAQKAGLSGLEFASGIPGTLGGGVAMNAGAYGGQLSDVLVQARLLENGKIIEASKDDMRMGYRATRVLTRGSIVLRAEFALHTDSPEAIAERMRGYNAQRRDKQPLELPSAGSTFKRPEGYFAGALIEGANLKGAQIGGAMVSPKHAGFIVNVGNATARDVLALVGHIQKTVMAQYGVMLELEVRIVGET